MLPTTASASTPPSLPSGTATSSPPIDLDVLFSRCMGSVSFALELLAELEASAGKYVDTIVQHTSSEQTDLVSETAHTLKGAAAIIGAEPLRAKAAEIEAVGRAGKAEELLEIVQDLRREMDSCLEYIPILRVELQRRLLSDC